MDEENNTTITVSMGGALYPENAKDYDSMFKLADKMLYMAKAKGKDRYIFYTPHVHGNILYDGKVMTMRQYLQRTGNIVVQSNQMQEKVRFQ